MITNSPTTVSVDSIEAAFMRMEGQYALVQHEVMGAFYLPAQLIPAGLKEGEKVMIKISTKQKEDQAKVEAMRKILEQMIN